MSKAKIQQLSIDRSEQNNTTRQPLFIALSLTFLTLISVMLWLNLSANAETNIAENQVNSQGRQIQTDSNVKSGQLNSSNIQINNAHATHAANTELSPLAVTRDNQVSNKNMTSVLDASGHVVARRIATVSSRVTGKLEKLNIEEGIEVKKFDILAELDNKQAQISYQLALAELAAQQASYQETLVMQKFAIQKSQRRTQLVKDKLISTELSEDSQLNSARISAQLSNKAALVELAKQRKELALYQLEQHKILAPFDGVVIRKNAQVGELISAGGNGGGTIRTGVGTIVDMSSLEVEVEVGESYINRVYKGQAVIAILDAYPRWQINSEVIAVIPTADRQKASIKVRIKLHEIDARVLPDMGIKVSFLDSEATAS